MRRVTMRRVTMRHVTMPRATMPSVTMPRVTLGSKLYFEEDEQPHCILHWAIGALYSLQSTVYSLQSTVYSTVYSLQSTVQSTVQSTDYSYEDCRRTFVHILHAFRNSTQMPYCVCRDS